MWYILRGIYSVVYAILATTKTVARRIFKRLMHGKKSEHDDGTALDHSS